MVITRGSWTETRHLRGVFDRKMCYLGDSCRSDGNRSSRINSLQFHSFRKTMSSDRLGILRQTHQSQRENVQRQKKKSPPTPLIPSQLNLKWEMWNVKPVAPCCTLQSELRPAAGHRSSVSPPPTLPLSSGPTGLKQQMCKNPNTIHQKWQNPDSWAKIPSLLGQMQVGILKSTPDLSTFIRMWYFFLLVTKSKWTSINAAHYLFCSWIELFQQKQQYCYFHCVRYKPLLHYTSCILINFIHLKGIIHLQHWKQRSNSSCIKINFRVWWDISCCEYFISHFIFSDALFFQTERDNASLKQINAVYCVNIPSAIPQLFLKPLFRQCFLFLLLFLNIKSWPASRSLTWWGPEGVAMLFGPAGWVKTWVEVKEPEGCGRVWEALRANQAQLQPPSDVLLHLGGPGRPQVNAVLELHIATCAQ